LRVERSRGRVFVLFQRERPVRGKAETTVNQASARRRQRGRIRDAEANRLPPAVLPEALFEQQALLDQEGDRRKTPG
jgi:hypothetical protein